MKLPRGSWFGRRPPLGVDVSSRKVKLVQMNAAHNRVTEAVEWDISGFEDDAAAAPTGPACTPTSAGSDRLVDALKKAREFGRFRAHEAVLALGGSELVVHNVRVAKAAGDVLERSIQQELEGRLPFPTSEAEVQYLEAGDVRHGDSIKREVVVLACHRPRVMQLVETVMKAGLVPVAIDAEPCALLRCYSSQLRREDDKHLCVLYVHIGATNTAVVIARGAAAVFVKYLPIGGQHLDEALARHLRMEISSAAALRRHHADRPAELQDPEIARAVAEASRPVIERWANELALCTRYFSVTFRGQMDRIVLGGGEATEALRELLAARMEMKAEVGNPLRSFPAPELPGRKTQWDVAVGLALRSSLA